jgi:hypothetical protein
MKIPKKFLAILITSLLITATLITALPVFAASFSATLSVYSGPPNTALYTYATGLTANGTNTYAVSFSTTPMVGATVIPVSGTITTYFGVPVLARGSYNIVIATTSDTQNTPYPVFVITPQIFLGSSSGNVGDHLVISGNGFTANATITIYFDGVAQIPSSPISTGAAGQFANATITVPSTWGGNHTVTAADYVGATIPSTYKINSSMTLSATSAAVGSGITVSGAGFAADSTMSFLLDSNPINTTVSTDASGKFTNINLVIPATYSGTHVITARDSVSHSAAANLSITSVMTISPISGPAGTTIAFIGKGFLANSPITVTYDGVSTAATSTLTSGADGSFSSGFKIPASASGIHVILVGDGTNSISANFNILSTAAVNPTSGPVGTTITAGGSGFKLNSKVTITYNGIPAGTVTTGISGSFNTTFAIPSASTGAHSLVMTDGTNTQTFSFTMTPTANPISPSVGFIGTVITLSGNGFGASKGITVTYDSVPVTLTASNTTDADGTFNVSFKAPVSKGGNHSVVFTDGTTSQKYTFNIDPTPPSSPTLALPAPLTKLGKIPTLSWNPVTDSNGGITYTLQISKDTTYATVLIEKKGLAAPTYTLDTQNPQEKLKSANSNAPYYWRVQAIDSASNVSAWTTPQTFLVGSTFGDYAVYIIFAVIAIMLGVIGFILGRITGRRA